MNPYYSLYRYLLFVSTTINIQDRGRTHAKERRSRLLTERVLSPLEFESPFFRSLMWDMFEYIPCSPGKTAGQVLASLSPYK